MNDKYKTKKQLLNELSAMRQKTSELEALESRRRQAEAERERLLAALQRRNTQLETATQVSKSASTILDPNSLINQAVNLIKGRFNFYYVGLFLTDRAGKYAVLRAGTGAAGRQMLRAGHKLLVGGESMVGWCVVNAAARIALDVGQEAVRFVNPFLPETRSEMALPLISRGQCVGALTVQSAQEAAFSEEDVAVLQTMADQLAIAIANARLHKAARREIARRIRTEEELRASEERFRTLFDDAPNMYFLVSWAGDTLSVNKFGAAYLGYTVEELVGQPVSIVVHPDDREFVRDRIASLQPTSDQVYTLEFRKIRPDGSVLWVEEFIRFQRSSKDEDYHMLVLCRDITERKQAEEELRQLKEFNESIIQSMAEGIAVEDAEGYLTFVNPAAAALLGYSSQELLGQHWTTIIPPDQHPVVQAADERRIRGKADRYEIQLVHKDGSRISALVSGSPRFEGERFAGTLAVFTDITERRRAEDALRDSEARYRTLLTQAPIGIVTCDCDGKITHLNPAFTQILGFSCPESDGPFDVLTAPGLVKAGIATDVRRCMEQSTQITAEYHYRPRPGGESILRLHLTPLLDEEKRVSGALIIFEDVTEQRRLEEQVIQSAKLASIGQLAAGVSHEINNPINGIINYAQLLLNQAEPNGNQIRFLEGILREGNRVADIVRDLLTFARVEKDAHSLAYVSDILQRTLALTRQQLRKDGIVLKIEEQPNLPQIKCRSQRIQQVFLNLISNARHALNARYAERDPNKQLTIRSEQVDVRGQPYVRISFHDRGVGIPAGNLPHLFTPFFTTKRPDEGTGLGLSVSYGIVQDHHGDIQVESVEGEYTVFWVDLPVDPGWEV